MSMAIMCEGRPWRPAVPILALLCVLWPTAGHAQSQFAGVYLGTVSGSCTAGEFGMLIRDDGSGVAAAFDKVKLKGFVNRTISVAANGTFSHSNIDFDGLDAQGTFDAAGVTGTLDDGSGCVGTFTGNKVPASGSFEDTAGFYSGVYQGKLTKNGAPLANTFGFTYAIFGPDGTGFALAKGGATVQGAYTPLEDGGLTSIVSTGGIDDTLLDQTNLIGQLDQASATAEGTFSASVSIGADGFTNAGDWRVNRLLPFPALVPHPNYPPSPSVAPSVGADLVADFGPSYGVLMALNNGSWAPIHDFSPEELVTCDLDGSGRDDVIADFGELAGLWAFMNNDGWVKRHAHSPEVLACGDLDGNGQDDLVAGFAGHGGTQGTWSLINNADWTELNTLSPKGMVVCDLDGGGRDDIVADFGSSAGIRKLLNFDGAWTEFASTVEDMACGDLDGSGQAELFLDMAYPHGIWRLVNHSVWVQLHNVSAEGLIACDVDGSGRDDMVVDFGNEHGVWLWMNDQSWVQLNGVAHEEMACGDLDGNGRQDLVIDVGQYGFWKYMNNQNWELLHDLSPGQLAIGNFDR